MAVDLRVQLGALALPNPVMVAAGTFGYGLEFQQAARLNALGALVTKTLTRSARPGNPPPRLVETPSGMLNAVGLQNVGLEVFLQDKLPALAAVGIPIIVSILGDSLDEVSQMCARLNAESAVAAIELNLSCPNLIRVKGEQNLPSTLDPSPLTPMVAQDAQATRAVVHAARAHTTKPLITKLSPDVTDLRPIAQAAEEAGTDALTIANTFTGMSVDPESRRSRLGTLTGGLSGPAIRPLALYRVWRVRQAVRCPIIGVGGIVRAEDALEFFLVGATAVAVGTAHFADPAAAVKVLEGLRRALERRRVASIHDLIGAFQEPAHDASSD